MATASTWKGRLVVSQRAHADGVAGRRTWRSCLTLHAERQVQHQTSHDPVVEGVREGARTRSRGGSRGRDHAAGVQLGLVEGRTRAGGRCSRGRSTRLRTTGSLVVWLPPPYGTSVSSEGYMPTDLYDLNSRYGSVEELRELIGMFHGRGVQGIWATRC